MGLREILLFSSGEEGAIYPGRRDAERGHLDRLLRTRPAMLALPLFGDQFAFD
jgi:hypothetical protein